GYSSVSQVGSKLDTDIGAFDLSSRNLSYGRSGGLARRRRKLSMLGLWPDSRTVQHQQTLATLGQCLRTALQRCELGQNRAIFWLFGHSITRSDSQLVPRPVAHRLVRNAHVEANLNRDPTPE